MRTLYWGLILVVSCLCLTIGLKLFGLTFGIKPVLMEELLDLKEQKKTLVVMAVFASVLFFIATMVAIFGDI